MHTRRGSGEEVGVGWFWCVTCQLHHVLATLRPNFFAAGQKTDTLQRHMFTSKTERLFRLFCFFSPGKLAGSCVLPDALGTAAGF